MVRFLTCKYCFLVLVAHNSLPYRWKGKAGVAYDECYHAACDGIDNLNVPVWVLNTKAAAHSIATYANSLKGIPRPRGSTSRGSAEVRIASLPYEERRHSACGHEIVKA